MLATSTHDSKRSEDVRTRIDVISEIPAAWRMSLRRWRDWNRSRRPIVDGMPVPLRNDEYLLYQTLLGAWPVEGLDDQAWQGFVERIEQYMLKAMREAKAHTSWANPNEEYEKAVSSFVRAILTRGKKNRFLPDFGEFQRRVSRIGMFNSLSQTLLKLTSPGMPDIYQGNEVWDYSLVDPDNRRPVDYQRRHALLKKIQSARSSGDLAGLTEDLLHNMDDGRIKLYVTSRALCARRQNPALFQNGDYIRLEANGSKPEHVVAFARQSGQGAAIVVAPRLIATLLGEKHQTPVGPEVWSDTRLELPSSVKGGSLRNVFTGEKVSFRDDASPALSVLLEKFPVALLVAEPAP
jgi:(1->4)-alpha-D-glucan 1-alpha-D-glucosylmutase